VAGFVGDSTVLRGTLNSDATSITLKGLGVTLQGLNINQSANGSLVEACVRPERIALHQETPSQTNCVAAKVFDIVYYGDHVRLLCNLGPEQPQAVVKLPLIHPCAQHPPVAGSTVYLEFPPQYTRIYAV